MHFPTMHKTYSQVSYQSDHNGDNDVDRPSVSTHTYKSEDIINYTEQRDMDQFAGSYIS
jgi:hypothetical protein